MNGRHDSLVDEALRAHKEVIQAAHATTESCWLHLDLTITQLKGLFALADEGEMIVGRMAEALRIRRPAASILVEGLVQLGLAERIEDPADRRRAIVRLSSRGDELAGMLQQGERRHMRAWFTRLDDDDLAALTHGLRALTTAAAGAAPAAGAVIDTK